MYLQYKTKVIAALVMMPLIFTSMSLQAQNADDIRDLVQMPLAVDKAVKAGLSARDVETITRSMREGRLSPHEFNQTLRNVSYIAAERGPGGVQDIGSHTSAAVRDGLRGQDLARSIHTRLQALGIPAGGRNGQGPPPMAEDFIPDNARDRIRQHQNDSGGDRGRRDDPAGEQNTGQGRRDGVPAPNPRNRMEQQSPGGPGGPGGGGGRPGGRP